MRAAGGNSGDPDNRHNRWGPAGFDRTNRLVLAYTWAFPSWKSGNAFERAATGGWKLNGTSTFQSGKPLTVTDVRDGTAYSNTSTSRAQFAPGKGNGDIVNKSGGTLLSRIKNNTYLNPGSTVFAVAPNVANVPAGLSATDYGNSSIGAARGPGNDNWDMALVKTTTVGGIREGATLEFRTEFFNVWNHPEYTPPATVVSSASYGQITSSIGSPRLIQFALKYGF